MTSSHLNWIIPDASPTGPVPPIGNDTVAVKPTAEVTVAPVVAEMSSAGEC